MLTRDVVSVDTGRRRRSARKEKEAERDASFERKQTTHPTMSQFPSSV